MFSYYGSKNKIAKLYPLPKYDLINMKTTEELKDKLIGKTYDECQKLLYMWIKQGIVSLKQFKELLHYCA